MANSTTNLDLLVANQAQKEVVVNNFMDAASPATYFGKRSFSTSGLTMGFYGGKIIKDDAYFTINNFTVLLEPNATSYIELDMIDGMIKKNTMGFTQGRYALYKVITGMSTIMSYEDFRLGGSSGGGSGSGFKGISTYVVVNGTQTLSLINQLSTYIYLSGTPTANSTVVIPSGKKSYYRIENTTSVKLNIQVGMNDPIVFNPMDIYDLYIDDTSFRFVKVLKESLNKSFYSYFFKNIDIASYSITEDGVSNRVISFNASSDFTVNFPSLMTENIIENRSNFNLTIHSGDNDYIVPMRKTVYGYFYNNKFNVLSMIDNDGLPAMIMNDYLLFFDFNRSGQENTGEGSATPVSQYIIDSPLYGNVYKRPPINDNIFEVQAIASGVQYFSVPTNFINLEFSPDANTIIATPQIFDFFDATSPNNTRFGMWLQNGGTYSPTIPASTGDIPSTGIVVWLLYTIDGTRRYVIIKNNIQNQLYKIRCIPKPGSQHALIYIDDILVHDTSVNDPNGLLNIAPTHYSIGRYQRVSDPSDFIYDNIVIKESDKIIGRFSAENFANEGYGPYFVKDVPIFDDPIFGKVGRFNGTSSYVLSNIPNYLSTNKFFSNNANSIEVDFIPRSIKNSGSDVVIEAFNSSTSKFVVYVSNSGVITDNASTPVANSPPNLLVYQQDPINGVKAFVVKNNIQLNQKYSLKIVPVLNSPDNYEIYVNGQLVHSTVGLPSYCYTTGFTYFQIGAEGNRSGFFNADFDNIRINYN